MADAATKYPPGEFIKDELDARGWDIPELARRMGGDTLLNHATVELLIYAPTKEVTLGADTSAALGRAFGVNPKFYLNLDRLWQPESHLNTAQPIGGDDA